MLMIIADKPQERAFLCLKSGDSFADCSIYTMTSRISTKQTKCVDADTVLGNEEEGELQQDPILPDVDVDIDDEQMTDLQFAARQEVLDIQVSDEGAEKRSVKKTLSFQLLVARSRRHTDRATKISIKEILGARRKSIWHLSVPMSTLPVLLRSVDWIQNRSICTVRSDSIDCTCSISVSSDSCQILPSGNSRRRTPTPESPKASSYESQNSE